MANSIVLSQGVRTNLLSLQDTSALQSLVQNRLATGRKVNSALDNPTSFFTAAGLNRRATDLGALLDGMSNGIKTIEAANNAVKAITKDIETMQANIRQARQDKSWKGGSYGIDPAATGNLSLSGGEIGTTPVNVALTKPTAPVYTAGTYVAAAVNGATPETYAFTVAKNGGGAVSVSLGASDNTGGGTTLDISEAIAGINADLSAATSTIRVRENASKLEFYDTDAANVGTAATIDVSAITSTGTAPTTGALGWTGNPAAATGAASGGAVRTVDEMVAAVSATTALTGKVRATNDAGKLRIENLSTEAMTVAGIGSDGEADGTAGTATLAGNDIRKNLLGQFNDLRAHLDKLSDDGSYNGVNLLRGDKLKVVFNEQGTSRIDIEAKNKTGAAGISTAANSLDIGTITAAEYASDDLLDARLDKLKDSMTTLQTHASTLGANLGMVQVRQDFTKEMINTLQTGADYLVNADMNEEGAKLLSLNTRQQLSQTALSLASQADQAVLRLFG